MTGRIRLILAILRAQLLEFAGSASIASIESAPLQVGVILPKSAAELLLAPAVQTLMILLSVVLVPS